MSHGPPLPVGMLGYGMPMNVGPDMSTLQVRLLFLIPFHAQTDAVAFWPCRWTPTQVGRCSSWIIPSSTPLATPCQ